MADTPPMSAEDRAAQVIANSIRRGQPHDGSDLDYAVDEDARRYVKALSSEGLAVVAQEDVQPRCPHCNGKLRRLSGADQDG